jgi:hypothetical protein
MTVERADGMATVRDEVRRDRLVARRHAHHHARRGSNEHTPAQMRATKVTSCGAVCAGLAGPSTALAICRTPSGPSPQISRRYPGESDDRLAAGSQHRWATQRRINAHHRWSTGHAKTTTATATKSPGEIHEPRPRTSPRRWKHAATSRSTGSSDYPIGGRSRWRR